MTGEEIDGAVVVGGIVVLINARLVIVQPRRSVRPPVAAMRRDEPVARRGGGIIVAHRAHPPVRGCFFNSLIHDLIPPSRRSERDRWRGEDEATSLRALLCDREHFPARGPGE